MTREQYERLTAPLRGRPRLLAAMKGLNRTLTLLCYVIYPVLLLYLYLEQDPRLLRCILVPAISFAAVSIFRSLYHAPRPYERGIPSLMEKKTKGHSFPSRHVFSAFMIAVTWWAVVPGIGAALVAASVLLGLIRVLGGVHDPRDVIAGAGIAVAAGLIGNCVVPGF